MNKRPKIKKPLSKELIDMAAKPFASMSLDQKFWAGFIALTLLTTVLVYNPFKSASAIQYYQPGEVARESMIAPADIQVTDDDGTESARSLARDAVHPIFRYEASRSDQAVQDFIAAWERSQRAGKQPGIERPSNSSVNSEIPHLPTSREFSRNEIDTVRSAIHDASEGYIYDDSDRQYFQTEVEVSDRSKPNQRSTVSMPESNWTALSAAREKLKTRLATVRSLSPKESESIYETAQMMIVPSVAYDSVATEAARNAAAANIQPITISLKRGQRVVDNGQVITPEIFARIEAVRNYTTSSRQLNRLIGLLLLIGGLLWAGWKFVQNRGILPRLSLSPERTFGLLGFIVLIQTIITAFLFRIADYAALQNVKAPLNDPMIWSFAIPFATGSLLMTLLADRPTAIFSGVLNSLIAGLIAPRGLEFVIYSALASSAAVYGIGRYRSRQTVTLAGGIVGGVCAITTLALIALSQQPIIINTVLFGIACGLAGGMITAAVTAVLMPVCESLFGILTDVKLLELSNADLPVLGQLAMRAPGTNQHSHAVGQLAEEACRVVGANGLLARIGALYHDIGKTAAPEHFVENQSGKNPHDRLKPAQSAKIIISHVPYGIKLGKEMGLPSRIVDFIPQHHGTRTLHYFLKKAQADARSDETISENDFRYPGPKPQFREAAIMMIADSCEAGARSLAIPNPENIRFIVTKIIDAIVADDQLDECDLTLRELTKIRESMIKSLVAIYHSRVDYPGYVPPNSGQFKFPSAIIDSEERGLKFADPADIPVSPGGEIEDEAIDRTSEPLS